MPRTRTRKHHRPKTPRIRRRHFPGASPGIVVAPDDALGPSIAVIQFSESVLIEQVITDVSLVGDFLADDSVTWINIDGLGDAATFHTLAQVFGLHRLAMEDVVNVHQRAKVEDYDDYLFIVMRMVTMRGHLDNEQVSMFLGKNFVLTVQERPGDCFDPVRGRLRHSKGRIRKAGADYLAYALIDALIDGYFPVVDSYGERMEQLDEQISTGRSVHTMDAIHGLRSDLMALRRAIRPLRDELNHLHANADGFFTKDTTVYLRDCYDHTNQIIDLLDSYRELCANLRDYYMSIISNRMNEVMKMLTIIGTIFIPLSFIAGVYGMNFNNEMPWNMPELNWPFGYVFALVLMLGVGLGLLGLLWHKGWLQSHES